MSTPYQAAARDYFDAGWYPIPLPYNAKEPVPNKPNSFTGEAGEFVSERQVLEWVAPKARFSAGNANFPVSNIALRLGKNVIGIDVDAYGTKAGAATLEAAEEEWGPLPLTYVSTSRDDGISGIRFFLVPEGYAWPGELPQGKGIEILQWSHRYAIVAPSINPQNNKLPYKWYVEKEDNDGARYFEALEEEFPAVADLPGLPEEWITGLTQGKTWKARALDEEMGVRELQHWLDRRPNPDVMCETMRRTVTTYARQLRQASDDGGTHDTGRNGAWAILGDAKAGHCGVIAALTELRNVFLTSVRGRRADEGAAKAEWARAVQRGAAKVTADENPEVDEDPCGSIRNLRPRGGDAGGGRLTSADINYRFDDIGNADRLIRVADGRARWVPTYRSWFIWDGSTWVADTDGQMARWAVKAVNQMEEELAFLEGEGSEALVKAFKAHKKSSGSEGKLAAMVNVARSRRGITRQAADFDADGSLIACTNGTLELTDEGAKLRPTTPDDYLTLNTGVAYRPEARHKLWDDYLERFLPDVEVREWLQMLAGYSLLGDNSEQLLVVGLGKTSTGKTTITEGLFAALGGYAGPMEASLLRASADDKARPDILKALPRRIIIAEELSEFQHLHVDQVKRITGAGKLSARGMASNVFTERAPAFTPWIMTNETPTIEGADAALKNRVLVVPFDVHVPRNNNAGKIRKRIVTEAREAILAWAVEGWKRYAEDAVDLRTVPAGALNASLRFSAEMSDFHRFLSDCCDVGEGYSVAPSVLYSTYEEWCSENGIKEKDQMSKIMFGKRLNALGTELKREYDGPKQVWKRFGIAVVKGADSTV